MGRSRACGDEKGGSSVEGTHNCFLREAYSPAFVHLSRCTPTFPSATTPIRLHHQTPYSLFLRSDRGRDNNSMQPLIVFRWKSHRQRMLLATFFLPCIFYTNIPVCVLLPFLSHSGRGFGGPRPPAGIREDNGRAFRWIFPLAFVAPMQPQHYRNSPPLCILPLSLNPSVSPPPLSSCELSSASPLWLLSNSYPVLSKRSIFPFWPFVNTEKYHCVIVCSQSCVDKFTFMWNYKIAFSLLHCSYLQHLFQRTCINWSAHNPTMETIIKLDDFCAVKASSSYKCHSCQRGL